jgi:hypothetical protein
MEREMNYFRKAVSMVVAVGLIVGIANIPVYSATVIGPAKYNDGYYAQKQFFAPSEISTKSVATNTKKTKTTKTKYFNAYLNDLTSDLKTGEKAKVKINCYNKKGKYVSTNVVTVTKEKNGKFSVVDKLINNGKKISYTEKEFKKFMQGKIATGITESGKKIKTPAYYNTKEGYVKYKPLNNNGEVYIATKSKIIAASYIKNEYNKSMSIINGLLKNKTLSKLAKTYLNEAKKILTNFYKSNKNNIDKDNLFWNTTTMLEQIKNKKASIVSLIENTFVKYPNILSSLKSILKKDITYTIYNKYGEKGVDLVNVFSQKTKLSQKEVYNIFVKNGITKDFMENSHLSSLLLEETKESKDIFADIDWWLGACPNVGKSLQEMKKLTNK